MAVELPAEVGNRERSRSPLAEVLPPRPKPRWKRKKRHNDIRFRGLSHHSTKSDAEGLDFRVRDGTGYFPFAMVVYTFELDRKIHC